MIKLTITDYFQSEHDITWDYAKQCGIYHGVIRLPETEQFDVTDGRHWDGVYKKFSDFGITPIVLEPMPNCLHDHIKTGDVFRDECIEKVIKMFPIMDRLNIRTICFNFMAHIGWLRTNHSVLERGGALVTGFDIKDFKSKGEIITANTLWENYEYFIKAVIPAAEKYGIRLALHPDDPPVPALGGVERIMISYKNICRAMEVVKSNSLGITMCQATYLMMGENLFDIIPKLAEKIFFIHFRNARGNKFQFQETFHDNGEIDMAKVLRLYKALRVDVPIRVDHVPTMAGETDTTGYTALGRLFAIGYLKGMLEAI
ncbi:mannonate dehydratase [Congzhengia sp.]|uniref:mannonate dehydratase n=1 Tax=Congzhengia sp. TaxID=2944168 RepID=UPI003078A004